MHRRGVIFDADDTLWMTMPLYTAAKQLFYKTMTEMGFDPTLIEQEFEKIDLENVQIFGLSRKRFPDSMGRTYELFCSRGQIKINPDIRKQLEEIGETVFNQQSDLLPGVIEALEALRPHFKLILASSGDQEVQEKRIRESGLSHYFSRSYIFPVKTERELSQILYECDLSPSESWMVGNSIRSDINPALSVGIKAVWIPVETWSYEKAQVLNEERVQQFGNVFDGAKFILSQSGLSFQIEAG